MYKVSHLASRRFASHSFDQMRPINAKPGTNDQLIASQDVRR